MAPIEYTPLPREPGSIRLLKILSNDNPADAVKGVLLDANINHPDLTPYEALSYTWGAAGETVDIDIGGSVFSATVNLEAALRALRKPDQPRLLWIDAICINQKDVIERGEQVRIMWDIYQAAEGVLVWLGPADIDSSTAMDNFAAKEAQTRLPLRNTWKKEVPEGHKGPWCGCHAGSWETYPPRIGIQKLAERRWFSRIWVLQEVAAAKRVTVMCGDRAVDGENLRKEMIMSADYNRNFQQVLPRIRPALELMNHSKENSKLDSRPLIELVESFRTWDATNPVDKVYALLGLSSDASDVPELRPDYTISAGVLSHKLVKFAFPHALIQHQATDHQQVDFEIDGLLLGKLSSWSKDHQTYWMIKTGESDLPGAEFNPVVLDLFKETWTFRIAGDRKLKSDSVVVLLRGASRPSVLNFRDSKYTVEVLAVSEPFEDGMALVINASNDAPPVFTGRGWDKALTALSGETDKLMHFKLSWDPFRPLDSSEVTKYTPVPNSFETQFDALLETFKDRAENGGTDYHDCRTVSTFWSLYLHHEEDIKKGTWPHLMTLHKAAYNGYYGTVKLLLDANADVNARLEEFESTAIHLATERGHTKIVRALILAGADVELRDADGRTPLMFAADGGHAEICKMLLDAGANQNPTGVSPNPLFIVAVMQGQGDLVRVFAEAGVDVDKAISNRGPTPLHIAAEVGLLEIVKILLAAGAQPNPEIWTAATPLHQAAVYGHTEVATELIEAGADFNAQDVGGMTPLDNALYCGQMETAKVICLAGGKQFATVTGDDNEEQSSNNAGAREPQTLSENQDSAEDTNSKGDEISALETSSEKAEPEMSTASEPWNRKGGNLDQHGNEVSDEVMQWAQFMWKMEKISMANKDVMRKERWEHSSVTRLRDLDRELDNMGIADEGEHKNVKDGSTDQKPLESN